MPYGIPQGHKQLPIIATPHVHPLDQLQVEKEDLVPKGKVIVIVATGCINKNATLGICHITP
jgi:hypothetical protein